jgi:hypothetical protein
LLKTAMAQASETRPSVLLIGAGGAFGIPVTQEFIRQKSKFSRTAILSAPEKVGKFAHLNGQSIEVVAGSFLGGRGSSLFSGGLDSVSEHRCICSGANHPRLTHCSGCSPPIQAAHPLLKLLILCLGTAHPCSVTFYSLYYKPICNP